MTHSWTFLLDQSVVRTVLWILGEQHQALPVKVIVLQFISHGPLIIVLQVHHHS